MKKFWITISAFATTVLVAFMISRMVLVPFGSIFSIFFVFFIIFVGQIWLRKKEEDTEKKVVEEMKITFLTTVVFIALRLVYARLLNLPPLLSWQYFLYSHGRFAAPTAAIMKRMLLTYTLDVGLILLVLYYFTFQKGEILKKLTWITGLGLTISVAIIATLQRVAPSSTKIIWSQLARTDSIFSVFLESRSYFGIIVVLGIAILVLGIAIPGKIGERVSGIGLLILVLCFVIFCYGRLQNFSLRRFFSSSRGQIQYSREIINGKYVSHTFSPGKTSLKSELPREFQIKRVDISKLRIYRSTPRSQRIRQDLPDSAVIFSRRLDYSNPSSWFSFEETRQMGYCNPTPLYVSLNAPKENVGGEITVVYVLL